MKRDEKGGKVIRVEGEGIESGRNGHGQGCNGWVWGGVEEREGLGEEEKGE